MSSRGVNSYYEMLLQNGLQNIQLIIAKAVIAIFEENQTGNDSDDSGFVKAFCMGLNFGTHYKQSGWGQGLTVLYD